MVLEPTITNSYSMDLIIKICGTLTTFIIFIFISAWHMTRKKYNLPPFIQETHSIKNIKDLLCFKFLNACYKESKDIFKSGVIATPAFDGKMAVIINDINWCFTHKPNIIFTKPFSLTPKCIKQNWKGVIFCNDVVETDVLRCLIVKGFESIDWQVIVKSLDFGLRYSNDFDNVINTEVSSQLIAFESIMGYTVNPENLEKKLIFITKLVDLCQEFSDYFYHGHSLLISDEPVIAANFIENIGNLLLPVIESSMFHNDSNYSNTIQTCVHSENVMSQIVRLRHHLREENASCDIFTIDNFSHGIFEHFFVLVTVLGQCLHSVEHLKTVGSFIIDVVKKEVMTEASIKDSKQKPTTIVINEEMLESSKRLVYTKAVVQEIMRVTSIGLDFDLSFTERDDVVGEFDTVEQSVIVLNHLAFSRSSCCHIKSDDDAEMFWPARFIKYDNETDKYLFYNSEMFLSFQDQWHVVGLPRNFICRLLLILLIKLTCPDFVISEIGSDKRDNYELILDLEKRFMWGLDVKTCRDNS